MDLHTATPVEIDTVLADLYGDSMRAGMDLDRAIDGLHYSANDQRIRSGRLVRWAMSTDEALAATRVVAAGDRSWEARPAAESIRKYEEAVAARDAVKAKIAPLDAEFVARGGWTRAFIVAGGHVHSSRNCSTCNRDGKATAFGWLPNLSGHDEAEIVDLAGDRACTVCYPSAPVETAGPSRLFHDDEVAAEAARKVRAEEKAARDAKKIAAGLTADGSEFVVEGVEPNAGQHVRNADGTRGYVYADRVVRERFKTEKAAVQWVVQQMCWSAEGSRYGWQRPMWDDVLDAVAAKHGKSRADVDAEIAAKVAAKKKRDAR